MTADMTRVGLYLLSLYLEELLDTMGTELLIEITITKFGELCQPLFLLKLPLHQSGILLGACLPCDVEWFPLARITVLDNGFLKGEVGIRQLESATVLDILNLVGKTSAYLFDGTFAITHSLLP